MGANSKEVIVQDPVLDLRDGIKVFNVTKPGPIVGAGVDYLIWRCRWLCDALGKGEPSQYLGWLGSERVCFRAPKGTVLLVQSVGG